MVNITEQEIRSRLQAAITKEATFPINPYKDLISGEPTPAAVLLPLLRAENQWHVLLTRRNVNLAEHGGQVAFPGGRADPDDTSPTYTALREAHEEIGLVPSDVNILGQLPQFMTITNYLITPVVGVIPWPYPLKLYEQEVSRAFIIPLNWLANKENIQTQERKIPSTGAKLKVIYFNEYDHEILWGASARLVVDFLNILMPKNGNGNLRKNSPRQI